MQATTSFFSIKITLRTVWPPTNSLRETIFNAFWLENSRIIKNSKNWPWTRDIAATPFGSWQPNPRWKPLSFLERSLENCLVQTEVIRIGLVSISTAGTPRPFFRAWNNSSQMGSSCSCSSCTKNQPRPEPISLWTSRRFPHLQTMKASQICEEELKKWKGFVDFVYRLGV